MKNVHSHLKNTRSGELFSKKCQYNFCNLMLKGVRMVESRKMLPHRQILVFYIFHAVHLHLEPGVSPTAVDPRLHSELFIWAVLG